MKNKKMKTKALINYVLILAALMLCIVPFAIADSDSEDSDNYVNESIALNSTVGAQMRLTELSLAIEKNIARGQAVIIELQNSSNSTKNTTKLEDIIAQMYLLLDEVNSTDASAPDRVETFVSLKSQAINLSWQFRIEARALAGDGRADKIREKVKDKTNDNIKKLREKLNEKRKEFNSMYAIRILAVFGMNDSATIEGLKNGSITMGDVRKEIKAKIQNMSVEERKNVFLQIREAELKRKIATTQVVDRIKIKVMEERDQRLKDRINKHPDRFKSLKGELKGKAWLKGPMGFNGKDGNRTDWNRTDGNRTNKEKRHSGIGVNANVGITTGDSADDSEEDDTRGDY